MKKQERVSKSIREVKKGEREKLKIKVSDIFLYSAILLTFGFLIFTIVDLFRSVSVKELTVYTKNFLLTFSMIVIATVIYLLLMYFERGRLKYPEWFKCFVIVSVLVFFLVYPFFGLYTIIYFDIIFNTVLGFLLSIVGVSIFYNYLRSDKNNLRARPVMVVFFSFMFATTIAVIIELIEALVNIIQKSSSIIASGDLIDICVILGSSLIINILFYISLRKEKVIINGCLITNERK